MLTSCQKLGAQRTVEHKPKHDEKKNKYTNLFPLQIFLKMKNKNKDSLYSKKKKRERICHQ